MGGRKQEEEDDRARGETQSSRNKCSFKFYIYAETIYWQSQSTRVWALLTRQANVSRAALEWVKRKKKIHILRPDLMSPISKTSLLYVRVIFIRAFCLHIRLLLREKLWKPICCGIRHTYKSLVCYEMYEQTTTSNRCRLECVNGETRYARSVELLSRVCARETTERFCQPARQQLRRQTFPRSYFTNKIYIFFAYNYINSLSFVWSWRLDFAIFCLINNFFPFNCLLHSIPLYQLLILSEKQKTYKFERKRKKCVYSTEFEKT